MSTAASDAAVNAAIDQYYASNVKAWFLRHGWLRNKDGVVTKYPDLKLRLVQTRIFDAYQRQRDARKPIKILVCKPRKEGATTGVQACLYHHLRFFSGRGGAVMGDVAGTSDTVFEMFRGFAGHDTFAWPDGRGALKIGDPENDLTDDITLPNGSTYKKVTAGSSNANRSGTIQAGDMTEVSYYPINPERDPALGFLGSWTSDGESSVMFMDSTANGPFGTFYNYCMNAAKMGWILIFVAWFEESFHQLPFENDAQRSDFAASLDRYEKDEQDRFGVSLEQLKWRRQKLNDVCGGDPDKFAQEFPSTLQEAFMRKARTRFAMPVLDLIERRAAVFKSEVGHLAMNNEEVTFVPDDAGSVHMVERPRIGLSYLQVFDSCTGQDQQIGGQQSNPDEHSIAIWRAGYVDASGEIHPPRRVMWHSSRLELETACKIARDMTMFYGDCISFIEVNGCGLYPVKEMIRLEAQVWMRPTNNPGAGTLEKAAGWNTNPITRRSVIDHLAGLVSRWKPEAPTFDTSDPKQIDQMKKFMVDRKGHAAAMPGEHDDTVMETAIALYNISAATEYRQAVRRPVDFRKVLERENWRPA